MSTFRSTALGLTLALSSLGLAKPPFLKVFTDAYKVNPNGPLGKARCLSCHLSPAPPKLNAFGLDVQAAMKSAHARMLTAEILKKVEQKDSDGDGFPNGAEIHAGTLPNDKGSKPAKSKKSAALATDPSARLGIAMFPFAMLALGRRGKSSPYRGAPR